MNKKVPLAFTLIISSIFFVGGYFWQNIQHNTLNYFVPENEDINYNFIETLENTTLFDFKSGRYLNETSLLEHDKTIIFFWSPTCHYCKKLYKQINFDSTQVGEIWIPITTDFEYLKYFIEKNKLNKVQLMKMNGNALEILDTFKVNRIPELWIVNKEGEIIFNQTGSELDNKFYELLK